MIKRKYDLNLIKLISLFESVTHASVEDAFEFNDLQYFIIKEGDMGKAIGKNGSNYKRVEAILKRSIKVIEHSPNMETFIKNISYPYKIAKIEVGPEKITITAPDARTRGMLIGRGASNLRAMEEMVKRYFPIEEIRVE
ncbi:MAG: NusA-like transcription termination signal-binding factor [Candidatus Woesearchaeota archaeon]